MGQYHRIVNHSKRERLNPYAFGDGAKLLEFGASGCGTMLALAVLLAEDNGKGGGDLNVVDVKAIVGSWAGDEIAIVGDYGEPVRVSRGGRAAMSSAIEGGHDIPEDTNAYALAESQYRDVSADVLRVLACDAYLKKSFAESGVEVPAPEAEVEDPAEAFTL